MSVVEQATPLLPAIYLLSLFAAAIVDFRIRRIPNLLVLVVLASGVAGFVTTGHAAELWQPLLAAIAILVVGTPLFARNWVGGGDVKLLAAAASWFSGIAILQFVAFVFLCGGVLALTALGWRRMRGKRVSRHADDGLPYAVAIAAGAAAQVMLARL